VNKWSVPKVCGIFLKQTSGNKTTIQTQNKYKKQQKTQKTNECFHSTMMTGPYHNMTCKLFFHFNSLYNMWIIEK
jgi:hypothetical protein